MPEPVHLINPLHSLNGGSERHTLAMFDELSKWTDVHLWSEYKPDFEIAGQYPIRKIDPARGNWPKGGNLVFVGVYFGVGAWAREAHPRRTIVFFNTPDYERFPHFIQGLTEAGFTNAKWPIRLASSPASFRNIPGRSIPPSSTSSTSHRRRDQLMSNLRLGVSVETMTTSITMTTPNSIVDSRTWAATCDCRGRRAGAN